MSLVADIRLLEISSALFCTGHPPELKTDSESKKKTIRMIDNTSYSSQTQTIKSTGRNKLII